MATKLNVAVEATGWELMLQFARDGVWIAATASGAWLLFRNVLRSPVYWSFVVAGLMFTLISILVSGTMFGTHTYPVTYQVLELAKNSFGLFNLITLDAFAFRGGSVFAQELEESSPCGDRSRVLLAPAYSGPV
ncbi:MAG: hypothetical protein ACT4TC_24325 [Myxococcaceae bacterium]